MIENPEIDKKYLEHSATLLRKMMDDLKNGDRAPLVTVDELHDKLENLDYQKGKEEFEKIFGTNSFYPSNLIEKGDVYSDNYTNILLQCPYRTKYGLGCESKSMVFLNCIIKAIVNSATLENTSINLLSLERCPWCLLLVPKEKKDSQAVKEDKADSKEKIDEDAEDLCNFETPVTAERYMEMSIIIEDLKRQYQKVTGKEFSEGCLKSDNLKTLSVYDLEIQIKKLQKKMSTTTVEKKQTLDVQTESLFSKILDCILIILGKEGIKVTETVTVGKKAAITMNNEEFSKRPKSQISVHPSFILRKFPNFFKAIQDQMSKSAAKPAYPETLVKVSQKTFEATFPKFFHECCDGILDYLGTTFDDDTKSRLIKRAYNEILASEYKTLFPAVDLEGKEHTPFLDKIK